MESAAASHQSQLVQASPATENVSKDSKPTQPEQDFTDTDRQQIMDRLISEKVTMLQEREQLRTQNQQMRVQLAQIDSQSKDSASIVDKDARHRAELQELKDASQQRIRELQAAISTTRAQGRAEGKADQRNEIDDKDQELNRLHDLLAERDQREEQLYRDIDELKKAVKADKKALADLVVDNEKLTTQCNDAEAAAKASKEAEKLHRSERDRAEKEAKEASKTSQEAKAQVEDAQISLANVKKQTEQAQSQALDREAELHATIHRQSEQIASMVALEDFQELDSQLQHSQADFSQKEADLVDALASKERSVKTLLDDLTARGLKPRQSSGQLADLASELVHEEEELQESTLPLTTESGTQTIDDTTLHNTIEASSILGSGTSTLRTLSKSLLVGLIALLLYLFGVMCYDYYDLSSTRHAWMTANRANRQEVKRSSRLGVYAYDAKFGDNLGRLNNFGFIAVAFEFLMDRVFGADSWSKVFFVVASALGAGEPPLMG